ncbi:rCG57234, isoform CRA_b [Rattus norvegicus]|uniref:RCG57234, isoform CRA_b n=1 Tax=Rattus norvegicus TaxID=10116 RepID=A6KPG4_RAT|nr:rCG57234, isoform CRA_b [Rattus norvegicus]
MFYVEVISRHFMGLPMVCLENIEGTVSFRKVEHQRPVV